jgi:tRNA (adenine37-N6)-methyltransferase
MLFNMEAINMIRLDPIGFIRTPYKEEAPYQPEPDQKGEFYIELKEEFELALNGLNEFKYIYIIYYLNQLNEDIKLMISPPWSKNKEVGLFASRTPVRPNPIGLSVVQIKEIKGNRVYVSGLDAFDNTPLLDIKPYIDGLDSKIDANYGWVDMEDGSEDDIEHLKLHINGIPHEH